MQSNNRLTRHFPSASTIHALQRLGIPLSILPSTQITIPLDPCSNCELQACLVPFGLDEYPAHFSIDTTSPLLGNMKAFDHLVLCSTGQTDWPHDVCQDVHSISGALRQAYPRARPAESHHVASVTLPGIFPLPSTPGLPSSDLSRTTDQLKVSILSSSHLSNSDNQDAHSLIILPDWVRLTDVTVDNLPKLGPNLKELNQSHSSSHFKLEKLPYQVVILICSHKTRDKRCAISAPLLEEALIESIEGHHHSWKVDNRADYNLDHLSLDDDDPDRERLVGLFKVSHSGGHKFAGNVIINFPSGISIWYGRVTPSDCKRIVKETIFDQKVIPELLKGGLGLTQLSHCQQNLKW